MINRAEQQWPESEVVSIETEPIRTPATPAQIAAARDLYATDEINIDDDATISDCGDGSVWVSAWVYVNAEELK